MGQDTDTLLPHILKLQNDTEKVNQLYTTGFDLIDKDPQLAFTFAQQAERISIKSNSARHISKSCNLMGILLFKHGYNKKALVYFEKYLQSTIELGNTIGNAFALTNLGNLYLRLKQYPKAENYFLQALNLYNNLNNKTEVANGLINLGVVKHEQKLPDVALENYQKALKTGEELNNYEIRAICLNNIAQIYFDCGNFDKSLSYNYDALKLREMMELEVDMADSHLSIAEVALKTDNYPLAEENLKTALDLINKHAYLEGKVTYFRIIADYYAEKNNFENAYLSLKDFNLMNDSLQLLNNDLPDFENISVDFSNIPPNNIDNKINNKFLIVLLFAIITFISFIIFKNKR